MAVDPTVPGTDPEIAEPGETKPGYQTTEFWLTVFTSLIALGDLYDVWSLADDRWVAAVWAIVTAGYSIGRGRAKSGVPYYKNQSLRRRTVR